MTRREWRDLGLVLAIALAVRLVLWWVLPRSGLVSDEPEYLEAAAWLARGHGFSFYADWPWLRPPVYLLFLSPFIRLFGLDLAPIRLAQMAISLLVPALVYLLGRTSFGPRVGLAAGLIAALCFPLAALPHLVLAENLFLPLLLAGMYCLVRWQRQCSGPAGRADQATVPREGPPQGEPPDNGPAAQRVSGQGWAWALAGGALLGLATLTRGLTIAFLPLAALWLAVIGWRSRPVATPPVAGMRRLAPLLHAALFAGAALLVILPWSGYNLLRYGRLILVDTTGGYNFWLGTQGGQFDHLRDVQQALLELPDPAARQAYAYQQGFAAIAADPGGFLGGRLTEIGQLLRINYSADERLVDGFTAGEVSIPHLLAVFLLEDTFYVLLVPLALLGLFARRGEAGRGLVLLWLGYTLLTAVAFFAIGRFRLPLLPFLAIYAAAAVERSWHRSAPPGRPPWVRLAAGGLLALAFWAIVVPSYLGPYPASSGATVLGVRARSTAGQLAETEAALAAGDLDKAWTALQPALAYHPDGAHPLAAAQVVLAEWRRASGDEEGALEALAILDSYQAQLLRGDILRARGDLEGARAEFGVREVETRNPTAWAWTHLHPPAGAEVDLGGGLDLGLMDGFYAAEHEGETTYRWSGSVARLRFPGAGTGQPLSLHLRLRGWRPAGDAPAEVVLSLEGVEVARLAVSGEWEKVDVPLPAVPAGADIVLTLRTTTFLAGPRDLLGTGVLRMLGVMVDWGKVSE